jgi:hypothetical protein
MGSVHHVRFKSNRNEVAAAMQDLVRSMQRAVEAIVGGDATFSEREEAALDVANKASVTYFEQVLQEMSDGYADELLIDGVLHRRSHEVTQGVYNSLCGTLAVMRAVYRRVGERNGPTVVPLELEAGMMERATPALAFSIAQGYANETSRQYVEEMQGAHRQVPSRSTVERIGKGVGNKAKQEAPRIERHLRQSEGVPEGTVAISVGLDRTTIPYEEKREDGQPPKTRRKTRKKPYVRTPPLPMDVNFHMAYVGTVSFLDRYGDSVAVRKYAATHHDGPDGILARMVADVRAAKLREPGLPVGVVQDGAPEMWNLVRGALNAEPSIESYLEAIDRYHLEERLGNVLRVTEYGADHREALVQQWIADLDEDDTTIDRIRHYIAERTWWYSGDDLASLTDNLTFIDNNSDRMRYVALRKAGLPVGSGATEGACKSLVMVRAKRSGQRWHNDGIAAVITLRAVNHSGRLPRFFAHLRKGYTARVDRIAA